VNQLIELERIDLTAIKPRKALAHVLEQTPQLLLVVGPDQLTSRSTPRSLTGHAFETPTNTHPNGR